MLVNKAARQSYKFSADFFRTDGHVLFSDLASARAFAAHLEAPGPDPARAADLFALSLLDEALHLLVRYYYDRHPGVRLASMHLLETHLETDLHSTLVSFVDGFPPNSVATAKVSPEDYIAAAIPAVRRAAVDDLLLLNRSNQNPAMRAYRILFDDSMLNSSAYPEVIKLLEAFYTSAPRAGAGDGDLISMIDAPRKASPDSIEGQLRFLLEKWAHVFGNAFASRLLRALDFLQEEQIRRRGPGRFRAEDEVYTFSAKDYAEYERFSPDRDWMPSLVLIAKNIYVWLDQLSRKYGREMRFLRDIPDEELDLLAQRGFTGLWLIGLWERSRASQRIKQRMGQGDAVASAYALHSYDIAGDLGGWDALANLRARAAQRGIRLSADMVPNHMGIDSNWVVEHPDWFLSIDRPPYSAYSYRSENLSDDGRAEIRVEDHYYDKSDAAVVFQRRDAQSGETRYIYHGNDGTAFPWNDTAQLDYTRADVREAVIQTILHVARNFPVIRFDAAMTLAKKHIQRLWFPEPGAGGAIPSRAQFGLTRGAFDARIPNEFWREVVDRVAAEVPDTLLLAEAFWLMEGYFVRTLGMHRVYNSAFMHMLRDEDNAKYRSAIKNTLEFDPQILRRYVNFMNNPDEKTAVEQFGRGDKYFGVATLLATLPGLPMFGHGQIEGFAEKYGMEFRRPKWDEHPDDGLIRGHEWKIFPLLQRRALFAGVEHFQLFDFYAANGKVNENVFAYSNMLGDERALVLYNNRYAEARGWVKTSAAFLEKNSNQLRQTTLAQALELPHDGFMIFRDYVTHLEYIRACGEMWNKGFYAQLAAYQHHVFLDWRIVHDDRWRTVHDALRGSGVDSIQAKWDEFFADVSAEPPLAPPLASKPSASRKPKAGTKTKTAAKKTAVKAKAAAKPAKKLSKPAAKPSSKQKASTPKAKKRAAVSKKKR